ncbi:hypothetical protein NSA11_09605 [Lactobacillus taiwanensis]|uniref:hypothetical protein n=1 Tax=Lactobacillus taiwanensis TaxID=508451 RepID=UPI00214B6503|nr:hypothetical protein [Lactobacillus taiwanensis]MCR1904161.1 hypothetical protein [Lactobacillus taiwanensis]
MKITQRSGYSQATAGKFIDKDKPVYLISTSLDPKYKWVDGHPTSEVDGYKAWFSQEGLPPFTVKFEKKFELPEYMSLVYFDNLEGCEIRSNVYFRAQGLRKVK